jgi:protein-S-isoprenylcysteine O-methyltransferase Ste14
MIRELWQRWEGHPEHVARDALVFVCAFAVLFSVAWSFLNYHLGRPVERRKRSVVDTSTMLLFFAGFSYLLARRIGVIQTVPPAVELAAIVIGTGVVVLGALVNVSARHQLGSTWANQIAIYAGHQLMTSGLFGHVRHPLYASTIWMFLGAAVAFLNCAAFLATAFIFVPAMYYRARQEEQMLTLRFPEYQQYRERTGAFFPKLFLRRKTTCLYL